MENDKKSYYEFIRTIKISPQARTDGTDHIDEYSDKINIYIYQKFRAEDIIVKFVFRNNNFRYNEYYELDHDKAYLDPISSTGECRIVLDNNIMAVLERHISFLKMMDVTYHLSGLELYDRKYEEIIFSSSSMFSNCILNQHKDNLFKYSNIRLLVERNKISVFSRSE